jgi:hypothetical protein
MTDYVKTLIDTIDKLSHLVEERDATIHLMKSRIEDVCDELNRERTIEDSIRAQVEHVGFDYDFVKGLLGDGVYLVGTPVALSLIGELDEFENALTLLSLNGDIDVGGWTKLHGAPFVCHCPLAKNRWHRVQYTKNDLLIHVTYPAHPITALGEVESMRCDTTMACFDGHQIIVLYPDALLAKVYQPSKHFLHSRSIFNHVEQDRIFTLKNLDSPQLIHPFKNEKSSITPLNPSIPFNFNKNVRCVRRLPT